MHKKIALLAVLIAAVLVMPIFATVYADVYVPPGPSATSSVGASDDPFPNLPTTSVTIEVTSGAYVFPITIALSNVPSGYDVGNQSYIGYCADLLTAIKISTLYSATLVSSLTLGTKWNEVNYILNNVPAGATSLDVQAAIWFVLGFTSAEVIADAHFTPTALAQTMASNAESLGATFVPGPGQIVAVEIVSTGQSLLIPLTEPKTGNGDMSEWITPSLTAWDMNTTPYSKVGWMYSTGPMYNDSTGSTFSEVPYASPLGEGLSDVGFGTTVMVLGFVQDVTVSMNEVPPPIELTITWDGVPNTVTLNTSRAVGANVPPTVYPDIPTVYQAAAQGVSGTPINKHAAYNVYYGPYSSVLKYVFGVSTSKIQASAYTDYGLWFWYKFTPNTGATIAYDCNGKVSDQPTYDITALFEYETSQIWFNHICFNVDFLYDHKTVTWETTALNGNGSALAMDQITIQNVGLVPATGLNLTEWFPTEGKVGTMPYGNDVCAYLFAPGMSTAVAIAQSVAFPWNVPFSLAPIMSALGVTSLAPGYNLTINQEMTVYSMNGTALAMQNEELIFSTMLAANQIPAFKDPIGVYNLKVGKPTGTATPIFNANEIVLTGGSGFFGQDASFGIVPEWYVPTPWSGTIPTLPTLSMVLDPVPVSLSGGSRVTSADVNLVREAICGLAPYNPLMDLNAKGYVNLQDLAAYKAAAGQ